LPGELTLAEIEKLADELSSFGLKHIVYSGGEPLLRRDFVQICEIFSKPGVKQSLLTNGLLLEKRVGEIQKYLKEIIVSIDGADAQTHNTIRGLNSFDQILKGIRRAVSSPEKREVSIRTVLQKRNFRQFPVMIELAKSLGVNRISFLSADVFSDSFGRDTRGYAESNGNILLNQDEVKEFRNIIEDTITKYKDDLDSRFISESPEKLFRILEYYEACIGLGEYPRNICNAPMLSAVITSTGAMLPCYFLPVYGNIRKGAVKELVNGAKIKRVRRDVKDYVLDRCKQCVCTLHINPQRALMDKF
jgi:MoaA/NifB/PqqE/SkfB family radical SAM enzyme